MTLPGPRPLRPLAVERECSGVTAACALIRRDVFDAVGGFDVEFPSNYNDVDFCLKVRAAGHRIVWTPWALWHHFESRTQGTGHPPAGARHGSTSDGTPSWSATPTTTPTSFPIATTSWSAYHQPACFGGSRVSGEPLGPVNDEACSATHRRTCLGTLVRICRPDRAPLRVLVGTTTGVARTLLFTVLPARGARHRSRLAHATGAPARRGGGCTGRHAGCGSRRSPSQSGRGR